MGKGNFFFVSPEYDGLDAAGASPFIVGSAVFGFECTAVCFEKLKPTFYANWSKFSHLKTNYLFKNRSIFRQIKVSENTVFINEGRITEILAVLTQ